MLIGPPASPPYNADMSVVQVTGRPGKGQYSEAEAAAELGISVGQLRTMIRSHVVDRDEDLNNVPVTTFQPSDLLILRLLTGMPTASDAQ